MHEQTPSGTYPPLDEIVAEMQGGYGGDYQDEEQEEEHYGDEETDKVETNDEEIKPANEDKQLDQENTSEAVFCERSYGRRCA